MFKLIFRTMVVVLFVIFLSIGFAVWKGGAPFRWLGAKTIAVGTVIQEIGDYIDNVKGSGRKVRKTFDEIKDTVSPAKEEKTGKK